MSAIQDAEIGAPATPSRGPSPLQFASLAAGLAVLGLAAIWPIVSYFWYIWTTDALKSIGMVVPPVSFLLILREWRRLGWEARGTWWGLLLLLLTIAAVNTQQHAILLLVISPHWATALLPPSALMVAYGAGVVLLFGGTRLFRAALFPILLLWFVNPVPHTFSLFIDLPLQRVSAEIARGFAMHLGQPLTPDHLRLMFTPEFGMFIAPGCNGIRGSITMGFIALIAGYVYRFRWSTTALVVTGAILLGYIFNLLRLCILVLYYLIALHFPSLQNKAENADYVIGACLFLVATILLFTVIQHLRDARALAPDPPPEANPTAPVSTPRTDLSRLAAMGLVALFGLTAVARAHSAVRSSDSAVAGAAAQRFPAHLGTYTLVRTWNENLTTGPLVYIWAQYAPPGNDTPIAIGVSPALGWHDPLICHAIRGEHPVWQGPLTITTADANPINFSTAFYADGVTQSLEASTQCIASSCGEVATQRTHFGLIYTRPDPTDLLSPNGDKAIPVLIRAETLDTTLPADIARQQLIQSLRSFLSTVKLNDLTQPYNQ
jgi:exosortase J